MKCNRARSLFSEYLDGVLPGTEMTALAAHLEGCAGCRREYTQLRGTQQLVSGLGRKPAPPELALRLRVALSREAALQSQRASLQYWLDRAQDALNGLMLPATAGVLTAIIFFGLMIGFFALPTPLAASGDDVPTILYTPAQLKALPVGAAVEGEASDLIVVETLVDEHGRVQDYRILSAPDSEHLRARLNKLMIFTTFQPATTFGRPTPSRVVLSFANVNVKG